MADPIELEPDVADGIKEITDYFFLKWRALGQERAVRLRTAGFSIHGRDYKVSEISTNDPLMVRHATLNPLIGEPSGQNWEPTVGIFIFRGTPSNSVLSADPAYVRDDKIPLDKPANYMPMDLSNFGLAQADRKAFATFKEDFLPLMNEISKYSLSAGDLGLEQ